MLTVSDKTKKERLEICHACEFLRNLQRCSKCGCIMPIKATLQTTRCPIGKWGPGERGTNYDGQ